MNKEVANSYFPLYRAEFTEYFKEEVETVSDEANFFVKVNFYSKSDVDSEWELMYSFDMDNIMVAACHVGVIYHNKKNNIGINVAPLAVGASGKKVGWRFPLKKVDIKQYVYGRDSGCSWSDPENDIRDGVSAGYYIKKSLNGEWEDDYYEGFGSFQYGLMGIVCTYYKLIESIPFEFSPYNTDYDPDDISMFEYHDHLFKFTLHIRDQKCICGEAITDFYNEYEENNSIKVDYLNGIVFIYNKNVVLVFGQALYMNAKKLITLKKLQEKYNISPSDVEWGEDNIKEWLRENHPKAKSVSSWMSWYTIGSK